MPTALFREDTLVQDLMRFIDASPSAWHAVAELRTRLNSFGFQELNEKNEWNLEAGQAYFCTRNASSLCAFILPQEKLKSAIILGSHTDSPALKLKPHGTALKNGCVLLSPEVYGGPSLSSWFNRELTIAGRVFTASDDGPEEHLVSLERPIAVIPHLAIHLDSSLANEHKLNRQEHLPALTALHGGDSQEPPCFLELFKDLLPHGDILSSELFLVPSQKSSFCGLHDEFISSYRLDNLLSVHANAEAFLRQRASAPDRLKVFVAWDNEEVGSQTAQGAGSTFLPDVLTRISESQGLGESGRICLYQNSLLISNDAAHAVHPNYSEKHEPRHQPQLGKGPVIKVNAKQRYATNAASSALLIQHARAAKVPIQQFVVRTDSGCGSTIGPIASSGLGINTIDIGAPILSMHAARELGACADHRLMVELLESCLS